jgi:hypothetical protein
MRLSCMIAFRSTCKKAINDLLIDSMNVIMNIMAVAHHTVTSHTGLSLHHFWHSSIAFQCYMSADEKVYIDIGQRVRVPAVGLLLSLSPCTKGPS